MELKVCPVCEGKGTVPTKCPRCFGSGKEEPAHTLFVLRFKDNKKMISLDNPRKGGFLVDLNETVSFGEVYIDKYIVRELKCTSAWYISRWCRKGGG